MEHAGRVSAAGLFCRGGADKPADATSIGNVRLPAATKNPLRIWSRRHSQTVSKSVASPVLSCCWAVRVGGPGCSTASSPACRWGAPAPAERHLDQLFNRFFDVVGAVVSAWHIVPCIVDNDAIARVATMSARRAGQCRCSVHFTPQPVSHGSTRSKDSASRLAVVFCVSVNLQAARCRGGQGLETRQQEATSMK